MANREPLATDEWYHCYNRGIDKRLVFEDSTDYRRFLTYLFVSNSEDSVQISERRNIDLFEVLQSEHTDKGEPLVEIGAYALMPNHLHFIIRQLRDGGIARFMQKIFTGYTMYFNIKRGRTGALFGGTFKSKHISNDEYLKHAVAYVLLNPVELFEPRWKQGKGNMATIKKRIIQYQYSSLPAFLALDSKHISHKITSPMNDYYDSKPTLSHMLQDAHEYYKQNPEV